MTSPDCTEFHWSRSHGCWDPHGEDWCVGSMRVKWFVYVVQLIIRL